MNLNNFYQNKINKIKKKTLIQREGDWICDKCKNLNFKFRVECNICKTPKEPKIKEETSENKNKKERVENEENKKNFKVKRKYNYYSKNYRNKKKRDDFFHK